MKKGISYTVESKELEMKLHELAKYAGVAPGVAMKQGGKMLVRTLMKLTPPSTFAQGRRAVAEEKVRRLLLIERGGRGDLCSLK